jgi:hypothetical protein
MVFFDKVHTRPYESFLAKLDLQSVSVESFGSRVVFTLREMTVGPFRGVLQFVLYDGSPLVHMQAVVQTQQDLVAVLYDAGLAGNEAGWTAWQWIDTAGQTQRLPHDAQLTDRPISVRHRLLVAETTHGSVAVLPPPHQFFSPRDWTDNLQTVWLGRGHRGLSDQFGFGVRQHEEGGGNFVPWTNAPPGTDQRLGVFFLLSVGRAGDAVAQALKLTRGDRFANVPGHVTLTSHYHMAIAMAAMQQRAQGIDPLPVPDFVQMFKDMNVQMVHLGEFHGDGHQRGTAAERLPELQSMFDECRRLSDQELLLIPGEEVNTFLGLDLEGKHPGHWMSLFPRPVYWLMQRAPDEPFVEPHPQYGRVYRVGSTEDMQQLIDAEQALVWAAHPRIKASSWTPDIFRQEPFYLADSFLGGAWKAMPADLSELRLGTRVLDLLDDMSNWSVEAPRGEGVPGELRSRKYVLGEVDVFKLNPTHELYGHMNINYLRMDRIPQFDEGWPGVLHALRAGAFWVTTGEVLLHAFDVNGVSSGGTVALPEDGRLSLGFDAEWTFPLRFAIVSSGDGRRVFHDIIDLTQTGAFGRQEFRETIDLRGRHWVRLEVWDVASNGAFTQPVWIETSATAAPP